MKKNNGVPLLLLFDGKFENGVKNRVFFFYKNGVPQLSLFDVKSENGVKNGVKTE